MIHEIEYSVTFPSTGQTLSGFFQLQEGTTAIIGPNWSGKTFGSIEITRYMLFGKKALRGKASDYQSLVGRMLCSIGGVRYEINRSSKKETICLEGESEPLAVNTEAVNQKVIEILGFGLEIFDFVCAAPQGQMQKFSEMTPSNRKKLIDTLLRLQPQELVEKACKEKAKEHRVVSQTLSSTLHKPDEPMKPDGYESSALLGDRITKARDLKRERDALQMVAMEMPEEPEGARPDLQEILRLEKEAEERRDLIRNRNRIEAEIGKFTFTKMWSADTLDLAEEWLDYHDELSARGDPPVLSLDQIETFEKTLAVIEFGETEVDCPACGHEFAPGCSVVAPEWSAEDLRAQRKAIAEWELPLDIPLASEVLLTRVEIARGRRALDEADHVLALEAELARLPVPCTDFEDISALRDLHAEWNAYDRQREKVVTHNAKVAEAEKVLADMPKVTEDVDDLQKRLVEAKVYETELTNYDRNLLTYTTAQSKMLSQQQLAEDFSEGAKAIGKARLTVKAYLAPALSRVASSLIDTMTAGTLSSLTVDEDMEITVGSQDISTLSGAGKTIANLALRIALGQVLTSRVFPVFIGDEIDSDMSPENAAATAEALEALKGHLKQVILITHKQIEHTDNLIIHPVSG